LDSESGLGESIGRFTLSCLLSNRRVWIDVHGYAQSSIFNNSIFVRALVAVDEQIFRCGFFQALVILWAPAVAIKFLFAGSSGNGMK